MGDESCLSCGQSLSPSARFCQNCGRPVQALSNADEQRHRRLTAAAAAVADKIRKTLLKGERRPVTALFADVVGSTAIPSRRRGSRGKALLAGVHLGIAEVVFKMREKPSLSPRLAGSLMCLMMIAMACGPRDRADVQMEKATTPSWATLTPALTSRTEVTAAASGNRILLAGGFAEDQSTVRTVEIYDVSADRFTRGPDLPAPVNHAMSAAADGVFYVMGGYREGLSEPSDRTIAFSEGKWRESAPMPEPRAAGGAAAIDGKIYVAGGVGPGGLAESMLVFNPASNSWSTAPGPPTQREHLGVAAFENRLYVVGGRAPSNLAAAEAFDPATSRWSRLPQMPTPRGGLAAAATSNGFIVAPGGEEAAGTFEEVEAFDIRRQKWMRLPALPTARHGLGVAAIGTTVYVIAGGPEPGFAFSNANESIDLSSVMRRDP